MAGELLSTEQMYAADNLAAKSGVETLSLMEAAGRHVAEAIRARWQACPTVVLCGPGNNGGDGFVAARLLGEAGWDVRVALLGSRDALKGDAAAMARRWTGTVVELTPGCLEGRELVVDAVFGAGLGRDITGDIAATLDDIGRRGLDCVAVDIPSGVDGDTGRVLGIAAQAALTVTFLRRRPGHLLVPGRFFCGDVLVRDIGIPETVLGDVAPSCYENTPDLWCDQFPTPEGDTHKHKKGHAVVVSGGMSATGAGRLAARGALRIGAGLVTVLSPPDALAINASQLTAVMVGAFDGSEALSRQLSDARRNAVLIGPGGGVSEETRAAVLAALGLGKSCVLDADALTSFEGRAGELFSALTGNCILTPHEGEFARLFGAGVDPTADKLTRARAAAKAAGAIMVLKGPDTVIAAPDGRAAINANAPPTLATAGSGDVLAGFCLGLLAQGMPAFEAACAAVWLHGAAAAAFGQGLISEDISEALPGVLRALEAR